MWVTENRETCSQTQRGEKIAPSGKQGAEPDGMIRIDQVKKNRGGLGDGQGKVLNRSRRKLGKKEGSKYRARQIERTGQGRAKHNEAYGR